MELASAGVNLIVAGGRGHVHVVHGHVGVEISLDHERGLLRVIREAVERLLLIVVQRRVRVLLEEGVLLLAVLLELAHQLPPNGRSVAPILFGGGARRARNRSSRASSMTAVARTRSSAFFGPIRETESGKPSREIPAGAATTGRP